MDIMISICCITYNHEKYISDAIEGFLMQKTSFPFEVIIHDDASTDRTAEIIRNYEKTYPEIIKPIYQSENQHSKGGHIDTRFIYPRAKGKYIALCEGDDYWTDPFKLQKQAEHMEKNPQCSLCTHAARRIARNNKVAGYIQPADSDRLFTTEEVISGGGGLFATNSMFYPKKLVETLPNFYLQAAVGDYPLTIYLSLQGEVHYIAQCMSDYRAMVENSWSSTILADERKMNEYIRKTGIMLDEINQYTNYKYEAAIHQYLLNREFNRLLADYDIRKIKTEKYRTKYDALSIKHKLMLYLGAYLPSVLNLSLKIRKIYKA
ncbi:MAG: glycosyl transferase family 2 [Firmicutes bacterium]|nr:glycosyl transferase family 2 [Bacillota bacterium]